MNEEKFYQERLLSNPNYTVFIPEEKWIRRAKVNEKGFNNGKLKEVLKNDYPRIYESIESEGYYIPDTEKFFYLFEIPSENEDETVGFASFSIYDENSLVMTHIYVLPENRGHKHFVATYNYFCDTFPLAEIYVKNPTRTIIDNIVEGEYCYILKDRFVLSKIFFIFDQVPLEDSFKYTNRSYDEAGKTAKFNTETNLYDLELDALISITKNNKIYTGKEDLLKTERSTISLVREEDEKRFNTLEKRRNDPWLKKGNYFKKILKIIKKAKIKREYTE